MNNRRSISSKPWRTPRHQADWREICAILPAYLENGTNGTVIYYTDGTREEVERRTMWVLNNMLQIHCVDKQRLHHQAECSLNMKNVRRLPLAVNPNFCLVPVNGRRRLNEEDSSIGYVVLAYVQAVERVNNVTTVKLNGGHAIPVYDSQRTLKRNLQLAKALVGEI